jgi:polysaccharide deacetylase family sporulation protein PdaB
MSQGNEGGSAMNVFVVLNGRKIKKWFLITMAAVFIAGVFYVEKENITVFSYREPAAIYSVQTDKKLIALTFDISWGNTRQGPILDVLEEKGVDKATFFLSSPWAKSEPEIVKRIVDMGFEIGSHGHKHTNYSSLDDDEIRRQILTAHRILQETTGQVPRLLRLPNGDFDKRVLQIADELNYQVIQWDTDSLDWMNIGVDHIVERVVSKAHPGDIILMHASDSCKQTHLALPVIIDRLRDEGYEFVTVSELIHHAEIKGTDVRDQALIL